MPSFHLNTHLAFRVLLDVQLLLHLMFFSFFVANPQPFLLDGPSVSSEAIPGASEPATTAESSELHPGSQWPQIALMVCLILVQCDYFHALLTPTHW